MKKRKFDDGGEVTEGPNPNIDDDTRARARKFVEDNAAPAKPKVVTKEALAKSGLSLRDYMNKQQGLTRRATPYTGSGGSGGGRGPTAEELKSSVERIPLDEPRTPVSGESASGSELGRNIKNTLNATAGLTGVKMAQMAAEGLTAPRAAASAATARRAELAGELRRGAQPTKFTSPSKATTAKRTRKFNDDETGVEMKKGGMVKKYAAGGAVSSRADGIAQRGKTRCKVR